MKRWTRKLLGIVLCSAMVIGMVPGIMPEAKADDSTPTIDGIRYTLYDNDNYAEVDNLSSSDADITIPEKITVGEKTYTVTRTGSLAFSDCARSQITIPNTVTKITKPAFSNCSSLNIVFLRSVPPELLGTNALFNNCQSVELLVHGSGYKSATGWSAYSDNMTIIQKVTLNDGIKITGGTLIAQDSTGSYYEKGTQLTLKDSDSSYYYVGDAEGKRIDDFYSSGINNTTLTMPDYDVSVSEGYYIETYSSNGDFGSVSGDGVYKGGQTAKLTATPNDGYQFDFWGEDGSTASRDSTYSFEVSKSRVLVANFATIPATAPNITAQPSDLDLTYGDTTGNTLTVSATAADDTTYKALEYQWYSCNADGSNPQAISTGGTSSTYTVPAGENAGTKYYYCEVTATREDNDEKAKASSNVATVTIAKADLTITAKDQEYVYNGQTQGEGDTAYQDSAEIAEKIDVKGLKGSDTVTSVIIDGQGKDIGTYPLVPSQATIGEATGNYNIGYVNGTLTITAPKMAITVNGDSGTLVYNGKEQTYTGIVSAISADTAFDTSKFSYTGSVAVKGKDVGSYTTQLNKDDCKYADNNYTADWTVGGPITLTITPKSITGAKVSLDKTQLTYNGSVQTVNVTGVTIDGLSLTSDDYEVTGNEGTDKGTYTVTVKGKGNFKDSATTEWNIVEKAMTVSAAGYTGFYDGQPHGITVSVTDPASGYVVKYGTVEGTYDLDTSPTLTDVGTLTVYFKVTAANYTDNTGSATITITEKPVAIVTTVPAAKDLTYTGATQELVTAGAASGGTMQYALGADATTIPAEGWSETVPGGTDSGIYYVWYKAVGDADHNDSAPACVTAEIKSAALTVTATGYTGAYDGQAHGITVTVVPAEGAAIAYGTTEGTYDLTASPTLMDIGTLTVFFKVSLAGYTDYTGSAVVTISKADAVVTVAPTAVAGLVGTGEPQALVTAGTASGGEMQYALGADAVTAPVTGWSTAIPTGTDAGKYYVWYKVVGDANHNDSAAGCVTVTIGVKEQINISKAKVGKVKNQTYTGKKIKPELQVILGDTVLVQGVDYDVKVDNKKIGYATARAVGKGNYTGKTKKVTFKIVPKPVKDKKIKVEKKGKNIEVSWKKNGKKLDGYEIQVSTNENFKKDTNKWIGIYDTKKTKFLVTSLEVGKTYYFRVRCYKYVKNGKDMEKFNSEWSETAMIELK